MTRSILVWTIAAAALSGLPAEQGRQGRGGGPPSVFLTDVPAHDLDVLQARPTSTSVTLSLLAPGGLTATLSYTPGDSPRQLALKPGVPQDIEIAGLSPDQSYQYTVAADRPLATGTFRTARPAGAPFTFDVQADSHLDGNSDPRAYANTLANIVADHPDFLIDLGDTFMTEKYPAFKDAARQYLAQRYYLGLAGRTMPIYLVLGNHDGEAGWPGRGPGDMTAWASATRQRYFPPVRPNAFYAAGPANNTCYAWTWGDALFVVLDPFTETREKPRSDEDGWAWTLGRAQYDWLRKTLETSRAPQTFVFIHHLVGGSSREARGGAEAAAFFEWGGQNLDGTPGFAAHRSGWPMPIHDLLKAHHVSAVFHGHDHLYVRQQRDGIIYQEVPQPSQARSDATGSAKGYGYASGTTLGSSGHVRVSVSASGATVEYVKSRLSGRNAEVVDRYVIKPAGGR
jgi:predicted phosphodiesterase